MTGIMLEQAGSRIRPLHPVSPLLPTRARSRAEPRLFPHSHPFLQRIPYRQNIFGEMQPDHSAAKDPAKDNTTQEESGKSMVGLEQNIAEKKPPQPHA